MPPPHLRLLTWEDNSSEESDVHLCRECEAVLWHRHESCPSCRAQSPHARVLTVLPRQRAQHGRLAVVMAVAGPVALVVVDHGLRWLLVGS